MPTSNPPSTTDGHTASVRTGWVVGVVAALAWLASYFFDQTIETDNPWIILIAPVVVGVLHRTFLVLSEAIPYFGYIVFGINRSPRYSEPPPAVPALAGEDAGFADNDLIWTLVGVLAIVALILYILGRG